MKKIYTSLFILIFVFAGTSLHAQYSRYIIQLKDKNGTPYTIGNPTAYLSAKSIARRIRYNINVDSTDLPITPAYIDSIRLVPNVTILNNSKWLNQVCIQTTDPAALAKINTFPFVKASNPIAVAPNLINPPTNNKFDGINPIGITRPPDVVASPFGVNGVTGINDFFNYGNNFPQVHIHEGEYLHNNGFHGEGMTIAILDAGFLNYLTNPVFDSIRLQNQILGTWDYVANEQSVNEDNAHGGYCLSTIAANSPGSMVGTAPKAKFWLFRTEDVATEYPVEEQNWVAAAEFADSVGVDLITSSLGYCNFDDPSFNHSYAQRDGKTAIISIGASLAVKKGILVTNSAGNSGNNPTDLKFVICPADADNVLAIGAVNSSGVIGGFSSWGPNGAGELKPNVVSVGVGAIVALPNGTPAAGNGTSFSNPNICGLITCLWQAFPEFNNLEIIDAVQKSSSQYNTPDNHYGYGIPNMRIAYQYLLQKRISNNYLKILGNNFIKAFPVPFNDNFTVLVKAPLTGRASLRLLDMNGALIETQVADIQQDNLYTLSFSKANQLSKGVYTIQYMDGKNKASLRIVKQ